jgi:hypothetical protein
LAWAPIEVAEAKSLDNSEFKSISVIKLPSFSFTPYIFIVVNSSAGLSYF